MIYLQIIEMACPSGNGGSVVNDPKTLMFNNYMKDCNKTIVDVFKSNSHGSSQCGEISFVGV